MKPWIRDLASVKWRRGNYSQSYQDMLLERIFSTIGVRNTPPFCVECGFNDASLTGGSNHHRRSAFSASTWPPTGSVASVLFPRMGLG
jgi:hypothetical protein